MANGFKEKTEDTYSLERKRMVDEQIVARGIRDKNVINAMLKVPRHNFVPTDEIKYAYIDSPLSIGEGQTISQPYIVAYMTEALNLRPEDKVLEIGTGSGYQAAVLAELVREVYTIEIIETLAKNAALTLERLGYKNIKLKCGDGFLGWPQEAPFDAIIITAAPKKIPQPLIEQLKIGGRMVLPLGDIYQELVLITKTKEGIIKRNLGAVSFVPMTGEIEKR
ncbi:MAG: protein-L-isoaspartate(D-aspartate) O-methyltransferase [Candidatus Omnitrophica bacterium]|nr:protein-L-isoaspartate(D-aspartate) O-methyltransferase [Candidatus Omnitrophota bacterium]